MRKKKPLTSSVTVRVKGLAADLNLLCQYLGQKSALVASIDVIKRELEQTIVASSRTADLKTAPPELRFSVSAMVEARLVRFSKAIAHLASAQAELEADWQPFTDYVEPEVVASKEATGVRLRK